MQTKMILSYFAVGLSSHGVEGVVHLAASSKVKQTLADPKLTELRATCLKKPDPTLHLLHLKILSPAELEAQLSDPEQRTCLLNKSVRLWL